MPVLSTVEAQFSLQLNNHNIVKEPQKHKKPSAKYELADVRKLVLQYSCSINELHDLVDSQRQLECIRNQ